MKPLIGINLDIQAGPPQVARVRTNYYDAILAAGGIPVLVPPMPDQDLDELLPKLSGILLIGGLDYSPALYGEQPCLEPSSPSIRTVKDFDSKAGSVVERTAADATSPYWGFAAAVKFSILV